MFSAGISISRATKHPEPFEAATTPSHGSSNTGNAIERLMPLIVKCVYNAERTIETFVKRFGAERLLVGSDSAPSLNLQIVRNAQISPQEKQMVLSGNARKLLNL
jgi:hypothetical protein